MSARQIHARPAGGLAVMASRAEARDSLDYFPTPPWATRALAEIVIPALGLSLIGQRIWEPACGEGHMVETLAEYSHRIVASDVHDYGYTQRVGSFVGAGPDVMVSQSCDWVITNPPFNLAEAFFERARVEAPGVALLVRTSWLESGERYARIFQQRAPSLTAIFSERVPMVKGRWDPKASTATSYCWLVWHAKARGFPRIMWIPPGQRKRLTMAADYQRWCGEKR